MTTLPFYLGRLDPTDYLRLPRIAVDFETTNLSFGDARVKENHIVMAYGVGDDGVGHHLRAGGLANWYRALPGASGPHVFVAHNAKFELAWLIREGLDVSNMLVFDTLLAEYVLAGNRRVALDLGSVAQRYGLPGKEPLIDSLLAGGVCPSEMPEHLLRARVVRDVETTAAIASAQIRKLVDDELLAVAFTRNIVTPVLAYIEREGMTLDENRVYEETLRVNSELAKVRETLDTMAGGRNLRSGPQMAELLYDVLKFDERTDRRGNPTRTASGRRATDQKTLESLTARTPDQKAFLEARKSFGKLDAALTKSLQFFSGVCREYGGRFQGSFNQAVTKTHRLSSSGRKIRFADGSEKGVQFQNLPRDYKKLFRASGPGRVIVDPDGSQLEFRVAAFLGQDKRAVADILSGADVHAFTASIINNVPEDKVTKKQRTAAKAHTFKPLFGGASGTAREKAYYEAFKEKYKGIADVQKTWVTEVLRTKELRMPWGLKAYWPGCRVTSSGYVEHTTEIYNLPIQSLATADIIPVSMVYTFWRIKAEYLDARIINTVHDSVPIDCAEEDVDALRVVLQKAFFSDTYQYMDRVYGMEMNVPLGLGINVSSHWGQGETEESYSESYRSVLGVD